MTAPVEGVRSMRDEEHEKDHNAARVAAIIRAQGMCGAIILDGTYVCIRDRGHEPCADCPSPVVEEPHQSLSDTRIARDQSEAQKEHSHNYASLSVEQRHQQTDEPPRNCETCRFQDELSPTTFAASSRRWYPPRIRRLCSARTAILLSSRARITFQKGNPPSPTSRRPVRSRSGRDLSRLPVVAHAPRWPY